MVQALGGGDVRALALAGPYAPGLKVLTVELRIKWYEMWLVCGNSQTPVQFHELEPFAAAMNVTAYCDHEPNPAVVRALAEARGWELDSLADDLITGRWHNEVLS